MDGRTILAVVSVAGAALGESCVASAAMDGLARQPDEASSITRTLVVSLANGRVDGHLLPGGRAVPGVPAPVDLDA